jgi:aminopeptidase N
MNRLRLLRLAAFALMAAAGSALALPQLEIEVRLDPATRAFQASARLADPAGLPGFFLDPPFEINALTAGDRRLVPDVRMRGGRRWVRLPQATREVRIDYRAELAPAASLDHREVLAYRAATAGAEGSFLPAGAGWYPDPGDTFSYRLALHLPFGQKGLVPGELVREADGAAGYRAEFSFPQPAEGIDLMAGPYVVAERMLRLPRGKPVHLRTWFHAELGSLAQGYLDDSARYIERYSRLIGDYPFAMWSVVSSPTPTGFGMAGLTYLGRDVIRLPFIRATSLGHEVLHNWWGNGVYPDWGSGNWSEGLTTFLADYAYKEDEGEDAARDMRLAWLRDLAAIPPGADGALKDFTSRRHGISSIVGYNKAAMVFLMLRDRIGQEAFERGLRLFWEKHRFRTASWADLEAAFAAASGTSQAEFFRQWVTRAGAPALTPAQIAADTDYRLWRRIDPALLPPILREIFVAPRAAVAVIDPALDEAAPSLISRLLDDKSPRRVDRPGDLPLLVLAMDTGIDAWLARHGLPPRPEQVRGRGSAQVWAGRDADGRTHVAVAVRDAAALRALERGLPHYGRQSWLVFDGGRAVEKGTLPPRR